MSRAKAKRAGKATSVDEASMVDLDEAQVLVNRMSRAKVKVQPAADEKSWIRLYRATQLASAIAECMLSCSIAAGEEKDRTLSDLIMALISQTRAADKALHEYCEEDIAEQDRTYRRRASAARKAKRQ